MAAAVCLWLGVPEDAPACCAAWISASDWCCFGWADFDAHESFSFGALGCAAGRARGCREGFCNITPKHHHNNNCRQDVDTELSHTAPLNPTRGDANLRRVHQIAWSCAPRMPSERAERCRGAGRVWFTDSCGAAMLALLSEGLSEILAVRTAETEVMEFESIFSIMNGSKPGAGFTVQPRRHTRHNTDVTTPQLTRSDRSAIKETPGRSAGASLCAEP